MKSMGMTTATVTIEIEAEFTPDTICVAVYDPHGDVAAAADIAVARAVAAVAAGSCTQVDPGGDPPPGVRPGTGEGCASDCW